MKKQICILLNGAVDNDARVIKTIKSLSKNHFVDLYHINSKKDLTDIFNKNVDVLTVPYPNTAYQKVIRHTLFYKEFDFFYSFIVSQNKKYDIIYCNDLPTLNVGLKLKKFFNAKLIYDSHEIYNETINQFFLESSNLFKNMVFSFLINFMKFTGEVFEKKALKDIDEFITVNRSLAEYFKQKYSYQKQIFVIMNFPYLFKDTNLKNNELRKKLKLTEKDIVLLYQGNLNAGRGLELIIKTIKELPLNFHLIIIGNGILLGKLKSLSKEFKIENRIHFIGFVNNSDLLNYTKQADVGFNLLEELNKSKAMASPNKLFEYIQAEIPSINTKTKENTKIVEKYRIGVLVKNEINDIVKKIDFLLKNKEFYINNCKQAKQELNWEKQENLLFKIIEN